MKCHTNVNSTPATQLSHKFSNIVAIFIHNHFESPNNSFTLNRSIARIGLYELFGISDNCLL
jgi:hypothetical protein